MLAIHISDKILTSRLQSILMNNPIIKYRTYLNRPFLEEEIQMANKYIKMQ